MYQEWDLQCHGHERWIIRGLVKSVGSSGNLLKKDSFSSPHRVNYGSHDYHSEATQVLTYMTHMLSALLPNSFNKFAVTIHLTMLSGCPSHWNEGWCQQQPVPQKKMQPSYILL